MKWRVKQLLMDEVASCLACAPCVNEHIRVGSQVLFYREDRIEKLEYLSLKACDE